MLLGRAYPQVPFGCRCPGVAFLEQSVFSELLFHYTLPVLVGLWTCWTRVQNAHDLHVGQHLLGPRLGVLADANHHLRLDDLDSFPDDADGVILLNAVYDLTDREIGLLEEYWQRRRGGVLVLLNPQGTTPRLNGFLDKNGISPRGDRVLYAESTGAGPRTQFLVQSTFVPGSRITEAFWGLNTTFGGQTCSLRVKEGDEELQRKTIEVKPLLEAATRFWGETSFLEKLPSLDPADNAPPVFVAASAELGALADERLRIDSSRMVVVGNATLADPDMQIASNYDFICASLNWLLDREELMGIAPKIKTRHHVSLSPEQHQRIFWICAITLPAAVAGFGLFVWAVRRV